MDLAADDLVPLIALVVLESRVTQLCFTIEFVNEFDFSKLQERELGSIFGIPNNGQIFEGSEKSQIAGCKVSSGVLTKQSLFRVLRNEEVFLEFQKSGEDRV